MRKVLHPAFFSSYLVRFSFWLKVVNEYTLKKLQIKHGFRLKAMNASTLLKYSTFQTFTGKLTVTLSCSIENSWKNSALLASELFNLCYCTFISQLFQAWQDGG